MINLGKGMTGAIIGGVVGIFLAIFGFWRTVLIIAMTIIGFLVGTYLEARKKE